MGFKMTKPSFNTKCSHCGYEWTYTGKLLIASCPSCRQGTKAYNLEIEKLIEKLEQLTYVEPKDNKRIAEIETELTKYGVDIDLLYETRIDPCE